MNITPDIRDKLFFALNHLLHNDSTGGCYVTRRENGMLTSEYWDPKKIMNRIRDIESLIEEFVIEMITIDSGNKEGKAWKHIFVMTAGQSILCMEPNSHE